MLQQNTRESALRRGEFHDALTRWLDESLDQCVGDAESHTGSAWLWVRHGGRHYYLDAGSTRDGVRAYMREVAACVGEPRWSTRQSDDAQRERVAVGRASQVIAGFEFYRHVPER